MSRARSPRLELRGITRESILAQARVRMAQRRQNAVWIGGVIKREAHLDMVYLKDEWGLRTNMAAVELALQYLAQRTREGLIHPGLPGFESIAPR